MINTGVIKNPKKKEVAVERKIVIIGKFLQK
jgi:hypothetical protein